MITGSSQTPSQKKSVDDSNYSTSGPGGLKYLFIIKL